MKRYIDNKLLFTDGYKLSHWTQYPPGTTKIYSYFESRGGKFPKILFFGLQYYLKKYLSGVYVTKERIDEAHEFSKEYFGYDYFNKEGWEHILLNHDGKLPIKIKGIAEGSLVNVKNVLLTIENTDSKCFWLTNFCETLLSKIWYSTTIATNSYYCKQVIKMFLEETQGDISSLPFKLVDFGARGVSSCEQAGIGGMAHLVNFKSTDTLEGILYANEFYSSGICGNSIAASEHSTITSWGKEKELEAYRNMLTQYPEGFVACVSDSYDIYNACDKLWGDILRDSVLNRKGTLVIRPDSGNPLEVIPKVLDILWDKFGGYHSKKGYKVLNDHVRIIQGDGIDLDMIQCILQMMMSKGFSAENIAFGSGGGLLQKFDRDTQRFAMKCSYAEINGKPVNVFKEPVTDSGKDSKRGRLKLVKASDTGNYLTASSADMPPEMFDVYDDQLETVFEDGEIKKEYTFDEIRKRAEL